jgi:hypothetical protein
MGLEEDSNGIVNGGLFISKDKNLIPFIKSFVQRETPNDFNGTIIWIFMNMILLKLFYQMELIMNMH